nr:MAG TPA: hypothetical protein [Caudoviricetes sp.]
MERILKIFFYFNSFFCFNIFFIKRARLSEKYFSLSK